MAGLLGLRAAKRAASSDQGGKDPVGKGGAEKDEPAARRGEKEAGDRAGKPDQARERSDADRGGAAPARSSEAGGARDVGASPEDGGAKGRAAAKDAGKPREADDPGEGGDARQAKESKESKDAKEGKEANEPKDDKDPPDAKESQDAKESKESRESKEAREEAEAREKRANAFAEAEKEVADRLNDEEKQQLNRARREYTDDLVDRYRPTYLNVYNVQGDMAGRDIRLGRRAASGHAALSVDATDLAALDEVFVAPPCVDRVRARLREPGLVVLTGPRGSGKATLATVLLGEICGANLRSLGRIADLTALGVAEEGPAAADGPHGVLAVDLDPQRTARTDEHTFRRLDKEFRARDIRLVLTTAGELPAHHRIPAEWVVEVDAPPARDVVTAHLLAMGAWERGRELLDRHDEIAELFEQRCAGQPDVGDLVELTRVLATCPEDRAGDRLAGTVLLQLRRWLAELPEPDLPYLLGVVMCHDLAYTVALDVTEDLLRRMRGQRSVGGLDQSRAARAYRLRAGFATDEQHSDIGVVPVEVVRWERPREAAAVVRLLWAELDRVRPALLRWLHNLGRHESWLVRDSVAAVVGVLMSEDFDVVRREVLEPWAASPHQEQRETALTALELVAADPRLSAAAERIVERWSQRGQDPNGGQEPWSVVQWTAVRAYGGPLGRTAFDKALSCLDRLAGPKGVPLRTAVVDSVIELAVRADPEQLERIVRALRDWVCGNELERHLTGVLAALSLAIDQARPGEGRAPDLLAWADTDDSRREVLAALWRRLLNASFCHYYARDVLTNWARSCEDDQEACAALARLLVLAARTARDRAIVRLVVGSWTKAERPPWHRRDEPLFRVREQPPPPAPAAPNAAAAVFACLPPEAARAPSPARHRPTVRDLRLRRSP